MAHDLKEKLKEALLDLNNDATLDYVQQFLAADEMTAKQAVDSIAEALEIVGRRFQEGDWFLGELVYAGTIAKEAMDVLTPALTADDARANCGTVVVGTIEGDMHDLGKSIFINYARSAGFDVIDLGVDVPAETFLEAVNEHEPLAVGMCCLLTPAAGGVGRVVELITERDLRARTKIIIGGAAMTQAFADEIGADAYAPDAVTGTDIIRGWVG